jgi:hypothetical protein
LERGACGHFINRMSSIVPGERGRRHLTQSGSLEAVIRPARRVLLPKPSGDASLERLGKKKLPEPPSHSHKAAEARHFLAEQRRSGFDYPERQLTEWQKKSVAWTNPSKVTPIPNP